MKILEENGTTRFSINCDLDSKNGPIIRKQIMEYLNSHDTPVIIDLNDVIYIDSSGINVLLTANKIQLEKKLPLTIAGVKNSVKKSIELGNLDKLLHITE